MSWLKLDMPKKALFLMDGDKILDQVAIEVHNAVAEEYRLKVPLAWSQNQKVPTAMVVVMDSDNSN
jgi:hypothetical protein